MNVAPAPEDEVVGEGEDGSVVVVASDGTMLASRGTPKANPSSG